MKYFSIETVVNAYKGFQDCMTNKSWGYLAILKGCQSSIRPSVPYEVDMDVVSNFLENIFNLSQTKRSYDGGRSLYVVFSNIWDQYFNDQGRYSPDIFDVIVWAYRRRSFTDNVTNSDIITIFSEEFNIPSDIIKNSFNTQTKVLTFTNSLYPESQLKSELSKIGVDVTKNNIDAKKGGVVASPGEISRGPFVQTLYAGLDITDYVLILQSDYYSLYGNGKDKSEKDNNEKKSLQQVFYGAPGTEYIQSYLTALRTKPFMLLAGISGTGKSRIVRKLAQATTTQKYDKDEDRWKDNRPENFELIQVKPNWHNSMDVVGFYSNISGKYEFTPFVEFIVKAWQHQDTPYFLCLDEMNLAPVEEYFAEFLSAIESRSTDEKGDYITDPIIKPFKKFGKDVCEAMLKHLLGEAHHTEANPLAIQFEEKGLTLPPNLMVMGTVNMDETTFSFSRKVLDRAMSVEMNEVDYDKFLSGESEQFPLLTDMNDLLVNRPQRAAEVTEEIESDKVIAYLKDVNTLMDGTPFKLGYRAANEAMLYVAACKKFAGSNYALAKALDEFTLMKILSRIEGDDSRLGIADDDPRIATLGIETSEQHTSLLTCLKAIVRKYIGTSSETEKKIVQMCNTLEREHFVSYWA